MDEPTYVTPDTLLLAVLQATIAKFMYSTTRLAQI